MRRCVGARRETLTITLAPAIALTLALALALALALTLTLILALTVSAPGFDGDLLSREAFGAVLAIAELGADETAAAAPDYLSAVAAPFASSEAVAQHGQSAALAVPQLGSCASSGRAWQPWAARLPQEEVSPLGAQPLPRLLELAASKATDFTASDHSGGGLPLMHALRTRLRRRGRGRARRCRAALRLCHA